MTPMETLRQLIWDRGGYVNCHTHLDRAGILSMPDYLKMGDMTLPQKWVFIDELKYSARYRATIRARMNLQIGRMLSQGCSAARTYLDADDTIGMEAIERGLEAQEFWNGHGFYLQIAASPAKGVGDIFRKACQLVDVVGGLPSRNRSDVYDSKTTWHGMRELFELAAKLNKPLDMQIDQANHPDENELEMLTVMAREYRKLGYTQGITAVHCISPAAWRDKQKRAEVFSTLTELNISVVVCPGAALSMLQKRSVTAPTHNSIAPVIELLDAGVNVAFGVDNIEDPYMPFTLGGIEEEMRAMLWAVRWQRPDLSPIADMMSTNGRKVLGLS